MLKENNKCFTEESKILFLFKFVKCISKLKNAYEKLSS